MFTDRVVRATDRVNVSYNRQGGKYNWQSKCLQQTK